MPTRLRQIDGTSRSDLLFGSNGAEVINAGAGNDLVFAGGGNDIVVGGAGSDIVFAGSGNDILVWRGPDNVGSQDIYLGGRGVDLLVLVITAEQAADATVQAEIAAFQQTPAWAVFNFQSLGLIVQGVERLQVSTLGSVEPENAAPVANADAFDFTEDEGARTIDLLSNDSDDAEGLTVRSIDATGVVGQLTLNADGTVTYDPAGAFDDLDDGETATVTFSYTVEDAEGLTASTTATITVAGSNDAPTVGDVVLLPRFEDQRIVVTEAELLEFAGDVDDEDLFVEGVTLDGVPLTFDDESGGFIVSLPENANGEFTLGFTVSDGDESVTAAAFLTVEAVNDGPRAGDVTLADATEDEAAVYTFDDLLAASSDVDGDLLTIVAASSAQGEVVVDDDARTVTFTPAADLNGAATIDFTVSDGTEMANATASLVVAGTYDAISAPATLDLGITERFGDDLTLDRATLLEGVTNVDGADLAIELVSFRDVDDDGLISDNGDGTYRVGDISSDELSLVYTISDGTTTLTRTATLGVTERPEEPRFDREEEDFEREGREGVTGVVQLEFIDPAEFHLSISASVVVGSEADLDFQWSYDPETLSYEASWNAEFNGRFVYTIVPEGSDDLFNPSADVSSYLERDVRLERGDAPTDATERVYGTDGDDVIDGLPGLDFVDGGEGNDILSGHVVRTGDGNNVVTLSDAGDVTGLNGGPQVFAGSGDDIIYGGTGADDIAANSGDDLVYGGDGDDDIDPGLGNDTVYGGDGDDRIDVFSFFVLDPEVPRGQNFLYGEAGDDYLDSENDGDVLDGGSGDDFIVAFGTNQTVTGGTGADTFRLSPSGDSVTITDFESGQDVISLRGDRFATDGIVADIVAPTLATQTEVDGLFVYELTGADGRSTTFSTTVALTEDDFAIVY